MTTVKGGRPRALTLAEIIRQSELLKPEEITKEDGYPGCNSLQELKRLWRSHRSNGNHQIQEGLEVTPSLLAPGSKGSW